jgi:hypothetical protein
MIITLEQLRPILRLNTVDEGIDTEIEMLREAALDDLEATGALLEEHERLVNNAIIMFVKARFGYANTESDRMERCYDSILRKLNLIAQEEPADE